MITVSTKIDLDATRPTRHVRFESTDRASELRRCRGLAHTCAGQILMHNHAPDVMVSMSVSDCVLYVFGETNTRAIEDLIALYNASEALR